MNDEQLLMKAKLLAAYRDRAEAAPYKAFLLALAGLLLAAVALAETDLNVPSKREQHGYDVRDMSVAEAERIVDASLSANYSSWDAYRKKTKGIQCFDGTARSMPTEEFCGRHYFLICQGLLKHEEAYYKCDVAVTRLLREGRARAKQKAADLADRQQAARDEKARQEAAAAARVLEIANE